MPEESQDERQCDARCYTFVWWTRKISYSSNAAIMFARWFIEFDAIPKVNAKRNTAEISDRSNLFKYQLNPQTKKRTVPTLLLLN